jgi:hypothetical protein
MLRSLARVERGPANCPETTTPWSAHRWGHQNLAMKRLKLPALALQFRIPTRESTFKINRLTLFNTASFRLRELRTPATMNYCSKGFRNSARSRLRCCTTFTSRGGTARRIVKSMCSGQRRLLCGNPTCLEAHPKSNAADDGGVHVHKTGPGGVQRPFQPRIYHLQVRRNGEPAG